MTTDPLTGGVGCAHWRTSRDVVAIRFHCCGRAYPCLHCHDEAEDHRIVPWPRELFDTGEAVLCRRCGHWMTVSAYLDSGSSCPACAAEFNPGCSLHAHLYFDIGVG
ncbi:CHY zinc finger protein [Corynebacterium sp. USCH3]|uniref:CHY zinc finger protein n=1 Tax=Corynebacterium sp. USCH3 TaxID=3024840 RepID=UPI00309E1B17